MLAILNRVFILLSCAVLIHCADTTKYQAEFRGNWVLEARKNAQGQSFKEPEISGVLEWYPIANDRAHVLMTFSTGPETLQSFDGVYQVNGDSFTRKPSLRIGGPLGGPIDETYEAMGQTLAGQIKSEDARTVLTHSDGSEFEFIGAQLIVTYKNGVVDRWKRLRDLKGTLAK
ncbi:MAG: hypothetical protein O3B73_02525 [bacterium]|nr:hypothetical protein [bacterium]